MAAFSVRKATVEDAQSVARLFIQARTECLPFLRWEYDEAFMSILFATRVGEPGEFLVAVAAGEVVGFIRFGSEHVDDLYVLPSFLRKGVGRALLDLAKKAATSELGLWVFQENRAARAFYEAQGFELEFETDGAGNMEKCPDARYVWRPT
jgi:ribosomal protein S18 acetylase RimI-like enzyme